MRREQLMEAMLDDLDRLAVRAAHLKCPTLQRLLGMAYLELRLLSVEAAAARDAAALLSRIRADAW
jgi:hypothetical protein